MAAAALVSAISQLLRNETLSRMDSSLPAQWELSSRVKMGFLISLAMFGNGFWIPTAVRMRRSGRGAWPVVDAGVSQGRDDAPYAVSQCFEPRTARFDLWLSGCDREGGKSLTGSEIALVTA